MKKIFTALLSILAIFTILLFARLIILYIPFIQDQIAFNVEYEDGQTMLSNNEFGVRFKTDGSCYVDAEVARRLLPRTTWSGELNCEENGYIVLRVLEGEDYIAPEEKEAEVLREGRVMFIKYKNTEMVWIDIVNEEGDRHLLITSPSWQVIENIKETMDLSENGD